MLAVILVEGTEVYGLQHQCCRIRGCKGKQKPPLLSKLPIKLTGWTVVMRLHCLTDSIGCMARYSF